jgi:hypothetical protein
MSRLFSLSLVSAISLTTFLFPASSQAASLSVVTKSQGSPTTPVVVEVSGAPVVANPFDRQLIRVVATIKRPDGSSFVTDGFYYQEYKLQNINGQRSTMKVGDPNWRFTFSSTIAGSYTSSVEVLVSGQKVAQESHSIVTNYQTIPKVKVDGVSFVRGTAPFVPIAYNIAWANRFEEIDKYEQWFSQASKAGVNVARVWMASWSLGIEWTDTGLGDYSKRLDRAWLLDQVFLIAAKYNIGINLVLINHGAFSTSTNPEWYSNPYNSSNGGPISNPGEFATNEIAWKFWEQRLRYIVARYAAYPSLFTWEWWNEVNFTPISSSDLKAWTVKSNAVLDQTDPYRTLRTSSWSSAASLQDWSIFDYAVTHVYDASDPIKSLTVQADALRAAVPNKPILVGEMGSGTVTEDPFADPRGLHLHNSQWAATFVGFAGPASYWWWDIYVDPLNLWPITTGLNKLISGLNVATMKPSRISGFPASSVLTLSSDQSVVGWIRHNNFDRSAKTQLLLDAAITALKTKKPIKTVFPDPVSKGGNLKVPVSKPGKYSVSFIHTFTGASIGKQVATTSNQLLSIKVPKFTGDLAFRIEAVLP